MINIPTTKEINDNIVADFKAKFGLSDDNLKKGFDAMSGVIAAQIRLLYYYLGDIQNNGFPDRADTRENGGTLERQGLIYLNREPSPSTIGVYTVNIKGTAGTILRQGLSLKSNDGSKNPGQTFLIDSETILTGNALGDSVVMRSAGSGIEYDLNVSDNLTITEPVIGLLSQVVPVVTITTQPKAQEEIDLYRQLIIDAIQLEPQGGARTDYRLWASDAQGVRKVYPYVALSSLGKVEIKIYVEATTIDSTDQRGTPSASLLTEVEGVIEFDPDTTKELDSRGRRPMGDDVSVLAIVLQSIDITITGLDDDSQSIKDLIFENVSSYLEDVRPFLPGADILRNKNDILYSARMQSVVTDTLDSGNFFTDLTMNVNNTSLTTKIFDNGEIPYLNSITYVD